jgi:hypothetical protein
MDENEIIEDLLNKVTNINNVSTSDFKTALDNVNRLSTLTDDNLNKLLYSLIHIIEHFANLEKDFINDLVNFFIRSDFDKNYFIYYAKLRQLRAEIEDYTDYLNSVLAVTITYPNAFLKQSFYNILKTMATTVNNQNLVDKVNTYCV